MKLITEIERDLMQFSAKNEYLLNNFERKEIIVYFDYLTENNMLKKLSVEQKKQMYKEQWKILEQEIKTNYALFGVDREFYEVINEKINDSNILFLLNEEVIYYCKRNRVEQFIKEKLLKK